MFWKKGAYILPVPLNFILCGGIHTATDEGMIALPCLQFATCGLQIGNAVNMLKTLSKLPSQETFQSCQKKICLHSFYDFIVLQMLQMADGIAEL